VKPPQRLCRGRLTDLNLGLCQRTVKSLSIHQDARNISDTSASANGAAAGCSINRYFWNGSGTSSTKVSIFEPLLWVFKSGTALV
jgi:hypothetical protein